MKKFNTFLLFLIFISGVCFSSLAQSLVVSESLYLPTDKISFSYESPSYSETDWIGIYHVGETPGGPESTSWAYIPAATGNIELDAPQEAGRYIAYLMCCDGYELIATSEEFTVDVPVLSTDYSVILENKTVTFNFKSPKFSDKDRIGIYHNGETPGVEDPVAIQYISSFAGTIDFSSYLAPGAYDAYLLCCDGFDQITMCSFQIVAPTQAFLIPSAELFEPGATLYFSYNDPAYADGDWIGIYGEYDDPAEVSALTWSKLVAGSGVVSFPGVIPGGSYIAILFCCNGTETEITRSEAFEVDYSYTETYVKTASSVYPEYTTILVNYRVENYTDTDWIGIYPKGVVPGGGQESLAWYYAPSDSGTLEFSISLPIGDYVVYLLCCDGYAVKAKYDFSIVDLSSPYIVATKISYARGEPLEFSYNSPNYVSTDWVGIYNAGEIPGSPNVYSITWKYLPNANGTMIYSYPDDYGENQLPEALPPGDYYAGLFCCDAYGLYAMASFSVEERGVGVNPVSASPGEFNIFPNPSSGSVRVRMLHGENMQSIKVYSLTGQVIFLENFQSGAEEKSLELRLNKGIYVMEVVTGQTKLSKKLIIQ